MSELYSLEAWHRAFATQPQLGLEEFELHPLFRVPRVAAGTLQGTPTHWSASKLVTTPKSGGRSIGWSIVHWSGDGAAFRRAVGTWIPIIGFGPAGDLTYHRHPEQIVEELAQLVRDGAR